MAINPIPVVYTCPLMIKANCGNYINANNITRMTKVDSDWAIHCKEYGFETRYEINDDEAKKIFNFYA